MSEEQRIVTPDFEAEVNLVGNLIVLIGEEQLTIYPDGSLDRLPRDHDPEEL